MMVISKDCGLLRSVPPFAVPPSSTAVTVTVDDPSARRAVV
jgi:hypothetical protein